MKFKIFYRDYLYTDEYSLQIPVRSQEIEADDFVIKRGFVGIWTEKNETPIPDIYINVDNVLTIKRIEDLGDDIQNGGDNS